MKWSNRFSKKTARRYQTQIKGGRLIAIILSVVAFLLITHQLIFTVNSVSCQTPTGSICQDNIISLLETQKGKSLFSINKKKIIASLKEISPTSQVELELTLPGKLNLVTTPTEPIPVTTYLNFLEPTLSLNSSRSADLKSPIMELDNFTSTLSGQTFNLFPNGELISGESESAIRLLFSEKLDQQKLKQIFILISTINRVLPITKGYQIQDGLYIKSSNLPDIIINSNSSMEELTKALQAIPGLAKIKEGIKIIDLRYKHPVIR